MLVDTTKDGWESQFQTWLSLWRMADQEGQKWTSKAIIEHCAKPHVKLFGWEIRGELAAIVVGRLTKDLYEVDFLATLPQYRGYGAMTQLLYALRNSPEVSTIWLEVSNQNARAKRLYEKIGMRQVGVRKKYYGDGSDSHLFTLKK